MKKRALISTLIIVVPALLLGWRNVRRMEQLRAVCTALEKQSLSGWEGERDSPGGNGLRPGQKRDDPAAHAAMLHDLAGRLRTVYTDWKRADNNSTMDEAQMRALAEVGAEISLLQGGDLLALMDEYDGDEDMPPRVRAALDELLLRAMGRNAPETLLKMVQTGPERVLKCRQFESILQETVRGLARRDAVAAVDWVLRLPEQGALAQQLPVSAFLREIAAQDPAAAFAAVERLMEHDSHAGLNRENGLSMAAGNLAFSATDVAGQAELLRQARTYLADHPLPEREQGSFLFPFVARLSEWDFHQSETVLAGLSEDERRVVAMNYQASYSTTGQREWMDWALQQLPPEDQPGRAGSILYSWMVSDWQGATNWLKDQPEGPVRDKGLETVGEQLSSTDPEMAAKMAEAMPLGEIRDRTLESVRQRWAKTDPAGAAEFARRNGLGGE